MNYELQKQLMNLIVAIHFGELSADKVGLLQDVLEDIYAEDVIEPAKAAPSIVEAKEGKG